MSKKLVYTIYDSKANAYLHPFCTLTRPLALRIFATAAQDPTQEISRWPDDFTLFEIGSFDDNTGTITNHDAKVSLGLANQFQRNNDA